MAPSPSGVASLAILALVVLGVAVWIVHRYALVETVRSGVRVVGLDWPAVVVGTVVLGAAGGLVAVAADPGAPIRTGVAGLLALGAAGGVAVAVANLDWYRASRTLAVVEPGDVEPGPVQVAGRVDTPAARTVESSVTASASVAYRAVTLEERAIAGRGYATTAWAPTSVAFDAVPFGLADSDLVVDGSDAEFPLLSPTSRFVDLSPASATLDGLERTVPAEPGTRVPVGDDLDRGERSRPRRYSERRIDPGDEVYVLGTAVATGDAADPDSEGGVRIAADPDGPPLVVVGCPAEEAIAHVRGLVAGYGGLGLASLVGSVVLAASLL